MTKAQKIAIEEELLTVALSDDSEQVIDSSAIYSINSAYRWEM
jgi:hypothetical protein